MASFEALLREKNSRLEEIPTSLQTTVQKQQKKIISQILNELSVLDTVNGEIKINAKNLKAITKISDELKSIFLNEDYLAAVKEFAKEFESQAGLNKRLIEKGFGSIENPVASRSYLDIAKRNAIDSLAGEPYKTITIRPIQQVLETAVVNGSTLAETLESVAAMVEEGGYLKYIKQITNDSFAISDRSYTSILSDALSNDWFYFAGSEVEQTRCFCKERVGNYYHYKEIESWGRGENLGDCNIGGGRWAGEIYETNESNIYSYLGGFNCMHSLMPVSESIVPESDIERTRDLGYIE